MLTENQLQMLRKVRNAAAVLFLLHLHGRPLDSYDLAELLLVNVRTIQRDLHKLLEAGLIIEKGRSRRFELAPPGRALFFGPPTDSNVVSGAQRCRSEPVVNDLSAALKNQESLTINKGENDSSAAAADSPVVLGDRSVVSGDQARQPASVDNSVDNPPPSLSPALRKAFGEAGIRVNPRTLRLAGLPHLTPEYVRAHHQELARRGLGRSTGLLIHLLEQGADAPALQENGHVENCTCPDCSRRKYLAWETGG